MVINANTLKTFKKDKFLTFSPFFGDFGLRRWFLEMDIEISDRYFKKPCPQAIHRQNFEKIKNLLFALTIYRYICIF